MTNNTWRRTLVGLGALLTLVLFMTVAASAQTKTLNLSGTVVSVEGNNLIVKMSTGEVHVFTPPADRVFNIDGKDLSLSQLKPGTKLNATAVETATSVMDRTVETLEGRVWYVSPPTVILILSTGEAKKYSITKDWTGKLYDGNKKEITVFDLRKDMQISGTKITEAPRVEFSRDVVITGTAPKAEAAAAPAPAPRTEAAPAPAPTEEPKALPKTGTPLPLVGLLGLFLTGASFSIRRFRR